MHIAIIVNNFPTITETFVINQITGLIQRGHDVTIFALHRPSSEYHHTDVIKYNLLERTIYLDLCPRNYTDRVSFILTRLWRKPGMIGVLIRASNIFKYKRLTLSLYLHVLGSALYNYPHFDIIHCQFGTLAHLVLKLKAIRAVQGKLVTSFRGVDISKKLAQNNDMYTELFSRGALFLPVCSHFKDILVKLGCDETKTYVLYSGIQTQELEFKIKSSFGHPVQLLSVGRLVKKKGFEYSIRAINEIVKQGISVQYRIIGDGVEYGTLMDTITKCNIERYVSILGWKDHNDVLRMIRESDILIVPSITTDEGDKEGIPNVLKEAMALGVPVITTFHSGIPELVIDNETGFLVPERNYIDIASRIQYIIENPNTVYDIIKKARKKVESEFNTDTLNDALVDIYSSVLNRN